ncbi:DUF4276 family protein [Flavobacterium sp. J27]|uniref:DUF4276 family protein n=1 Tax=Flavobacterium sp. J27 TaxID=2060419 RepID=UPI00103174DD|nr:DUF4276 family protein [Flavobacterium sp. J27]
MKRIIIICEGQTEIEFCKKTLSPYFISKNIYIQGTLIKKSQGGIVKWESIKNQILNHLKSDKNVFVTTFIDYYGLYASYNFPNWEDSHKMADKNSIIESLEDAMKIDLGSDFSVRFIPYIQLHEFEGLLFNDIKIFYDNIPKSDLVGITELEDTFAKYNNPEMINNSKENAPSKRLTRIIKGYNKIVYGNILAEEIGLTNIRNKSPRFNNWINIIESILLT